MKIYFCFNFKFRLAIGCLSPRKIYHEIKKYEKERTSNQSTYWVIFELLWRDYFKFVALKYGNKLFQLSGIQEKDIPWKQDKTMFAAWKGTCSCPNSICCLEMYKFLSKYYLLLGKVNVLVQVVFAAWKGTSSCPNSICCLERYKFLSKYYLLLGKVNVLVQILLD